MADDGEVQYAVSQLTNVVRGSLEQCRGAIRDKDHDKARRRLAEAVAEIERITSRLRGA